MGDVTRGDQRTLSVSDRRFLLVLGLPAFGISLAYSLATAFVPVLLDKVSGPLVTGALIGAEGVVALFVPVLAGIGSDRLHTSIGGRLPLIFAGAVVVATALLLLPAGRGSLTWVGIWIGVFFIAYFVYYTPYYALYPDLVPEGTRGRSQGIQGAMRAAGLLLALGTGGIWLALWRPLPFVIGAVAVIAMTVPLLFGVRRRVALSPNDHDGAGGFAAALHLLRSNRELQRWAAANMCWEAAISSLRTFVVLYFTVGLGLSLHQTSASLSLVGVSAVVAAPVAGRLADRHGAGRVMLAATWVFTAGLLSPLLWTSTWAIAAILPVAFAAVVLMTLPYTMLMDLMPSRRAHGAGAGLFGLSRGVGVIAGPVLSGLAIQFTSSTDFLTFEETEGFAACFGVAALMLLMSIPLLRSLTRR